MANREYKSAGTTIPMNKKPAIVNDGNQPQVLTGHVINITSTKLPPEAIVLVQSNSSDPVRILVWCATTTAPKIDGVEWHRLAEYLFHTQVPASRLPELDQCSDITKIEYIRSED